jgi:hypothetical protein
MVLLGTLASADILKNSLTNMLNEKESTPMVNLTHLNVNAKPKPIVPRTRSKTAVVAMINKHKILKKEADDYLKERTQGKVKNFDHIPKKQRLRLIEEMALPYLAKDASQKDLSKQEKEALYVRTWMQSQASKIIITDAQALGAYQQIVDKAKENNASHTVPPFEQIKEKLKEQMIEREIISDVMKDVKINIL